MCARLHDVGCITMPNVRGRMMHHKQRIMSNNAISAPETLALDLKIEKLCTKVIGLPGITCTDRKGRFSARSKSSNNCLMVICDYGANVVLAQPKSDIKITILKHS